jgi:uncharacterized protein YbbC (DUF1343 family)
VGATVKTGLDRLVAQEFRLLQGRRVAVLTHAPAVDAEFRPILSCLKAANVDVRSVLAPEHGFAGAYQDMEDSVDGILREPVTGARLHTLYGNDEASLHPTDDMLADVDVLVVDLQDVGARYYTYAATMAYAMETAAKAGIQVMVLDRPNPLGGRAEDIEGPLVEAGFASFVGAMPIPIRHGMTLGELARRWKSERNLDVDLEVVALEGWRRDMLFDATGLPWVLPSPNMPTLDTALIYPGQCLLEGTNLSEGRGTTRPFELCGAPFLDGEAWAAMAAPHIGPGYRLRPTTFRPMFQKHAGTPVGGLQIHRTGGMETRSLRLTVALLWAARRLANDVFAWRTETYEFVSDRLAIDLLFGSESPRALLESGAPVDEVMAQFEAAEVGFAQERRPFLLYRE